MKFFFLFLFGLTGSSLIAQPQNSKWYFGYQAALDFMSNPPTPLNTSAMNAQYGCASQADLAGNLLFYTDGITVYNAANAIMANGTGLLGNGSPVQPCLIIKKPGSPNLHYIFTVVGNGNPGGLNYSIIDMALAAGLGSVTVKNASLYAPAVFEKISGTLHCNGVDFWVVIQQRNSNTFMTYLLTANGVNTTAVISSIGPANLTFSNLMKISPSGNKLATTTEFAGTSEMSLFDFDNTSGQLSNYQSLYSGFNYPVIGIEFSPDGSKLYGGDSGGNKSIHQWDLCAGTLPAIMASHYSVAITPQPESVQLAIDGKIYISQTGYNSLGVISNPNNPGAFCNYVPSGQSLGTNLSAGSLPNFVNLYKAVLSPFSYSVVTGLACHAVSFAVNPPVATCAASNYSVVSLAWNFGDPATGTLNTSYSANPLHIYSSSGTFTSTLVFYYKCGTDTIRQAVYVPPPDVAITVSSNCNITSSATVAITGGIGPYTYSWSPGPQTSSIVSNLNPGSHTVTVNDAGLACSVSTVISIAPVVAPVMSLSPSGSISICSGSSGTVQISGNVTSFSWSPQTGLSINNPSVFVSPPASQIYTIIGALNSCTVSATLQVTVNPLPTPTITGSKSIFCVNSLLEMQGSGGTQFLWTGPAGFSSTQQQFSTLITSPAAAGIYTLTVTDQNGCKNATTTVVGIVPPPQGELKGIKPGGCAPFCSDYYFEPQPLQSPVLSSWEIEGNNFSGRFNYCFTKAGNFQINGTLIDTVTSCSVKTSYFVQVLARPKADFAYTPDYPIADIEDVEFINKSSGDNQVRWSWYFNGTESLPSKQSASGENVYNHFDQAGTYIAALLVSNSQGCTDTIVKSIKINEDFTLFVPNTFTPNNDFINDIFLPVARGVKILNLRIFNRWGTKIYESQNPGDGWDGSYHGDPAQDGVYIWTISYTSEREEAGTSRGEVLLKR